MKDLITGQEALKINMLYSAKGDFMLKLFAAAKELDLVEDEIEVENKLTIRLFRHINQNVREIKFTDQIYVALKNVMYVLELYLKSPEFKRSKLNWCDVIKMIDQNTPGLTKLIYKSEEYLNNKTKSLKNTLDRLKNKALTIPYIYQGYIELINEISTINDIYNSYINSKDFLYELPIVTTTNILPIFTKDNIGFEALYQITNDLAIEFGIIGLFKDKEVNNLQLRYMEQLNQTYFYNNLFELVISNYLFANVISDSPKKLLIDVVDAKIIFSEIFSEG